MFRCYASIFSVDDKSQTGLSKSLLVILCLRVRCSDVVLSAVCVYRRFTLYNLFYCILSRCFVCLFGRPLCDYILFIVSSWQNCMFSNLTGNLTGSCLHLAHLFWFFTVLCLVFTPDFNHDFFNHDVVNSYQSLALLNNQTWRSRYCCSTPHSPSSGLSISICSAD